MKARRHKKVISRRTLSKEDIERGKNFDQLLTNYEKVTKPLFRNPKMLRLVILICVILLVLVIVAVEEGR